MKDKLIAKLKELNFHRSKAFIYQRNDNLVGYHKKANRIESEIASIEAELAKEPSKTDEITDEDIEAWAEKEYGWTHKSFVINRAIEGAKAMRDGEIKHIEK